MLEKFQRFEFEGNFNSQDADESEEEELLFTDVGDIEVYGDGVITMNLEDQIYTPFYRDHEDAGEDAKSEDFFD